MSVITTTAPARTKVAYQATVFAKSIQTLSMMGHRKNEEEGQSDDGDDDHRGGQEVLNFVVHFSSAR
jgi:hypothetical protein